MQSRSRSSSKRGITALYPRLSRDDDTEYKIGVYVRIRQRFLEEYHFGAYNQLFLFGELWNTLLILTLLVMNA